MSTDNTHCEGRSWIERGVLAVVWFLVAAVLQPVPLLAQQEESPGDAVQREFVPVLPGAKPGERALVRALPMAFDAQKGEGTIPLEFAPAGFWKSQASLAEVAYDVFEFEIEAPVHLTEVGEPKVPILVTEVDIPPNAELDEVILKEKLLKSVENITLVPNQEPLPIGAEKLIFEKQRVTINKQVYEQEKPYPGKFYEVTTTGHLGSRKTVVLKIFPVQFYPAAKKANFYRLTGTLKFKAKEIPKAPARRDVLGPEGAALDLSVPNIGEAQQWSAYQREIGTELLKQFDAAGFRAEIETAKLVTIPSVIICADLFYCPARELAAHRGKKGIATWVFRAKDIERGVGGKDGPDKIRNFVRILHRSYKTRWLLLFGDVVKDATKPFVHVPVRMARDPAPYGGVDDGWIPCDYYYACLDGTWDGNNNGKYGEAADKPDLLPEVWVGRLPTNNLDDAYRIVRAIIAYENKPPTPKGSLLAANDLGWGCHEIVFKEGTILPLVKSCGSNVVTRLYQKWANLSVSTFAKSVNGGVDFIEYYGHGCPSSTQLMTMAQVRSMLKQTRSYPVVFALSCSTSRYDNRECFGEAWIEGAKASAYVGSTRVAYGGTSSGEGLDTRFIKNFCAVKRTGIALDVAKYQLFVAYGYSTYTLKTILEFSLFGDPVMLHVK